MNKTLTDRENLFKNHNYEIGTMISNYPAVTIYEIVSIYLYIIMLLFINHVIYIYIYIYIGST